MTDIVQVQNLRKTFALPHQQRNSLKEHFLHPLQRTTYERQEALRDVSFTVERGESFGIIGANGSGKSTLLKILAGIYRQDAGSVQVSGALSPFIELGVGFNPELSARDNVRINATLLGLSRKELGRRFDEIFAFAELERFVDQKLKNYSSGMQVRLAFSIAIQVPFDVLLLDEVLAVGDARFQEKCFATFDAMQREEKTIVLVTHDLSAVTSFCDRALYLKDGCVGSLGPSVGVVETYERDVAARATQARALEDPSARASGLGA